LRDDDAPVGEDGLLEVRDEGKGLAFERRPAVPVACGGSRSSMERLYGNVVVDRTIPHGPKTRLNPPGVPPSWPRIP
jgi:hypothetical protein